MRTYQNCYMLIPASFKLVGLCCSCVLHPLPWIAWYRLILHHTWLSILSCSWVVCLPCCVLLFDSSCFVAIRRIRSSTLGSASSVRLLHGLVLLPCGISGKMTMPSKSLLSLLASCSIYCYAMIPTTCYIMPPILPCQASNHPFLANRCLAKLPLLLSPSYSVASCRWSEDACSMLKFGWVISHYINALTEITYILARVEG